jgi:hypothetical protein
VPAAGGPSLILSTSGLDKIRSVSASSWSLVAEAGCSIKGVQTQQGPWGNTSVWILVRGIAPPSEELFQQMPAA